MWKTKARSGLDRRKHTEPDPEGAGDKPVAVAAADDVVVVVVVEADDVGVVVVVLLTVDATLLPASVVVAVTEVVLDGPDTQYDSFSIRL
jgi:hypothetical protein